jgi:hypothetical protein
MQTTVRVLRPLLLLSLAGCGPAVQSMLFVSPAPTPKPPGYPIRIYSETRPECPFEEIGRVSSRKRGTLVSMDKVTESLRERARKMGGDAIIGLGERPSIVESTVAADDVPVFSGTVVRFEDPNCTR